MKINLIKTTYWMCLSIMKKILSLYEYKVGKNSEEYRYFKQQIMDFFFLELGKFYKELLKQGLVKNCECKASLRCGFSKCEYCGGSGYAENT